MPSQTVVYIIGVFDLFHRGHIELLRRARALGDKLIVAVNGDEMTSIYKRRPYFSEDDRLELVKACRYVDDAFIARDFDNRGYVLEYKVNKIVHGDDWSHESYIQQIRLTPEFIAEHNVEMVYLPYWQGISTSDLVRTIQASPALK
jgi:glycerol-3-phosphate cytidylyltransferase